MSLIRFRSIIINQNNLSLQRRAFFNIFNSSNKKPELEKTNMSCEANQTQNTGSSTPKKLTSIPSSKHSGYNTETFVKPEFLEKAKKQLSDTQYNVAVERGTEPAYTGKYDGFYRDGNYYCVICDIKLFESDDKFNSGCGWPAFSKGVKSNIEEKVDNSYGMRRVETLCSNCGAHLGHVFNDGPVAKGGMRYCINSASINFRDDKPKK